MEITAKIAHRFRLAALQAVDWWMTASDVEALCPPCAEKMKASNIRAVKASAVFGQDAFRVMSARVAAWDKLPKGWTEDSLKSFWGKMGGSGKHKVTACMDKMKGKIDDPGAFCASLADHFNGTGWRGKDAGLMGNLAEDDQEQQDKKARAVAARFIEKQGMEHDSPEALKQYLKDHPGADKSKHTVKKTDKEEAKGKKDEGGKDEMTPKPGKKEQEMGGEIQQWQGPGTPAINSVGSYLTGGHPVSKSKVRDAIKELESTSHGDPDAKKLITKMKKFIGD